MEKRSAVRYEMFYPLYERWYRVNAFPVDEGLSIFFSNITEEKKIQHQLQLEQLLREKRIEALAHMAGGLAHEISNPLAIIHARASDLERLASGDATLPATDVRRACDSIVQTSDRAMKILRGLRGFAREELKDPMQMASIHVIANECMEFQQARFDQQDIKVRLALDSNIPLLLCRPVQIGQILTNFLNNAFDAITQSNSLDRWINLSAEYSGGDVSVEVTDSGPGIEDHFKTHLMEPFFSTKELGLGMGIGLSLSRAIAQDHGGTLMLRKDGMHACFRLILPVLADTVNQQVSHLLNRTPDQAE